MTEIFDPVNHIMEVMEAAFDPVFGEAWNRRQVGDSLTMSNCHYLLMDETGQMPGGQSRAAGFALSRRAANEEELLLIAVRPEARRKGIGSMLIGELIERARLNSVTRLFLEMRDGNPAQELYLKMGFEPIGRRPNYYNRGTIAGIDAITFALSIECTD